MKRNLLLNFLNEEHKEKANDQLFFDYLHFNLNNRIYSYGAQFKSPNEYERDLKKRIKDKLFNFGIKIYAFLFSCFKKKTDIDVILSSAYFNLNNNSELNEYLLITPPWIFGKNQKYFEYSFFKQTFELNHKLAGDFKDLLKPDFISLAKRYKFDFKEYVVRHNIKALFLPQDIGFFEKMAIDVFKELNLPTFNFIHGLPGIYNDIDYNRTDYLVVWGESIKKNFVKAGLNPDKIIVNGHPKYSSLSLDQNLRFELDNILIITKSLNGSQFSDSLIVGDRSNLIYYLLSIKKVLEKLGVKKVRLRPHPSENIDWYHKYIEKDFFVFDTDDLKTSLTNSSLVIGGTSTTFLEALIEGVNYVVYEPLIEDTLIDGFYPVAPFDRSEKKVPVARSEEELEEILTKKVFVDLTILNDYISKEFKTDAVLNLLKTKTK
ncbi:hypothetical protein CFS9_09470 [Flavobacterium sp. CFS9]|uniref:CDP-Glycerol:Poly(Glycerophosphate) glycerophosphotransferase n=1 Tax=Flavobacterium sp. CFS9 TaxID=3143118 RepID=A0AAT9GYI9_9FLAO